MTTKVALVTGASSGIGEATALKLREAGYTVYGAARRVQRMQHLTELGDPAAGHGRHRRHFHAGRRREAHRRHRPARRPRQQRRLRFLRRRRGRPPAGGQGTVRGQRVRRSAPDPAGPAAHAGAALGNHRQHHLGRWPHVHLTGSLVPRHEVRAGSAQRLPAHGAQALRDRRRGDRTGRGQSSGRHRHGKDRLAPSPAPARTPRRPTLWPTRSVRRPTNAACRRRT
ncbi:hypothetical protein SAFG77S_13459 [Streptomyces afghaniensis]